MGIVFDTRGCLLLAVSFPFVIAFFVATNGNEWHSFANAHLMTINDKG